MLSQISAKFISTLISIKWIGHLFKQKAMKPVGYDFLQLYVTIHSHWTQTKPIYLEFGHQFILYHNNVLKISVKSQYH